MGELGPHASQLEEVQTYITQSSKDYHELLDNYSKGTR